MKLQTLFRPANNFITTFSWKIQQDKAVSHCSDQFKRLHLVREWGIPKNSRKMGKKYFARNIKKFIGQISFSLLQTQPGIEGARPWLVCASTRWCQFSETFVLAPFMIERILVDMNSKEKWPSTSLTSLKGSSTPSGKLWDWDVQSNCRHSSLLCRQTNWWTSWL